MMHLFTTYVGIDYSGAKTTVSRNNGLRVFKATDNTAPIRVKSPAGKKFNWTRKEIAHWCLEQLKSNDPVIIGIDQGFSFPMSYMERYQIAYLDQFLEDFQRHWPTDQDNVSAESLCKTDRYAVQQTEYKFTEIWTSFNKY